MLARPVFIFTLYQQVLVNISTKQFAKVEMQSWNGLCNRKRRKRRKFSLHDWAAEKQIRKKYSNFCEILTTFQHFLRFVDLLTDYHFTIFIKHYNFSISRTFHRSTSVHYQLMNVGEVFQLCSNQMLNVKR